MTIRRTRTDRRNVLNQKKNPHRDTEAARNHPIRLIEAIGINTVRVRARVRIGRVLVRTRNHRHHTLVAAVEANRNTQTKIKTKTESDRHRKTAKIKMETRNRRRRLRATDRRATKAVAIDRPVHPSTKVIRPVKKRQSI